MCVCRCICMLAHRYVRCSEGKYYFIIIHMHIYIALWIFFKCTDILRVRENSVNVWENVSMFKMRKMGVPAGAQQVKNLRMQVWSLASLSALRIRYCHKLWHRSQMQLRSSVAMLTVVQTTAPAPVRLLAQELPCATSPAIKIKIKKLEGVSALENNLRKKLLSWKIK